ncbi:MAG TPA: divalent-cation tolerance protein CutA [Vicinamibacterales bacterium]|nr:divalent-cation tolerance protein CutA [Vicinamibacterales bacterium]
MEIDCVIVWTTVGTRADGQKLASTLVAEGLAACVNVLGEMESTYRWKGQIETEREHQVVIKTTAERVPALKARLHALHQYELPEFIVLPIVGGSEAYLQWIRESVIILKIDG